MKIRVVGINFDHFHMGDLLRMAFDHPDVEIAGICDESRSRMQSAVDNFKIPENRIFTDVDQCLERAKPDFVVLCPATARHGEYVERVARHRVHMLVEKPFAGSVKEADRMITAAKRNGVMLAINWPLRWVAAHATAYRLLSEGRIGDLEEVHHYGGNRGPLYHGADKVELVPTAAAKRKSWFYKRELGGGSMLDYLGYGTTLGTWYHHGRKPIEVTAVTDLPNGLEVDEHSITIARYATGLSKFETRWGTFTDPWVDQPQPKCGFVLKGTEGTISSYDYESSLWIQTLKNSRGKLVRADALKPPYQNPIQYLVHCLHRDLEPEGPLSARISRIGQQIVDTAVLSAKAKRTLALVG